MEFRPCIDIHNGQVKQIVGGSLRDDTDSATENFISPMSGADYAKMYREHGLRGGHIILLNARDSAYYPDDVRQAKSALCEWRDALQVGGGIDDTNAASWIEAGASHVIVTSYVFDEGEIRFDRIQKLVEKIGKERLVLDLSCRKKDGKYYIVTNRWQTFTKQPLDDKLLERLSSCCDEFLVHAVNVEGTKTGVDEKLLELLSKETQIPMTYAGGISSMKDLEIIEQMGNGKINFTVGSALDLFGGSLSFEKVVTFSKKIQKN